MLNQPRVDRRRAHVMRDAILASFSNKLDDNWFEAISETSDEAEYLKQLFRHNVAAQEAS